MNNVDTIRMAKALLESAGFVVVPRGDYDKDQQAFVELDDENKALRKQLDDLKASPVREQRHTARWWEDNYPHRERVGQMKSGETIMWTMPDERMADLLRDAINHYISRSKASGTLPQSQFYRCRVVGNVIGCKRTD